MADDSERDDPVLVRPYITTEPGGGPAERSVQTWPATAALPEHGTRELPRVDTPAAVSDPAAKSSALRRQRLLVVAAIGALALLGGAGLLVLLGPDDPEPGTARPGLPAPGVTGSLGAPPAQSASAAATPSRSPRRSTAPAATPGTSAPAVAAPLTSAQPSVGPPAATTAPPPDQARTGPITAAGGRCLSLGGLLAIDGSPVQTAACTGGTAQRWTLDPDGTLRVVGRCAQAGTDATVRIGGCDDRPAAQWRAGPGGSLVNPATGHCLTDPGTAGATTTVAPCTGAADQRWTLP